MIATLALLDGCAIFAALCAATFGWHRPLTGDWAADTRVLTLLLTLTLGTLIALYYADAYDLRAVPGTGPFVARLPRCVAFAAMPLGAAYVFFPNAVAPAAMVIVAALVALPVVRSPFYTLVHRGVFAERVLVIGTGPLARRALEAAEDQGRGRCVIVGVVDDELDVHDVIVPPDERLGPLSRLDRIIKTTEPDRIVMALAERRRRLPIPPLLEARLRGIMIEDGAAFYERLTGKIAIEALTPSSLIFSQDFRVPRLALWLGRALSLGVALVGLVVLAPVIGAIALAIHLDSAGPVLFVQERVGRAGRRFLLFKFRTMFVTDAAHSEWARDNADRITRVGCWLRRFRLDELPQFVNVIRGDMDLVGPRPHPFSNFSLFVTVLRNSPECGEQIPFYSIRSMARPGITGWAQVRYRYANNLEEEIEKMRYDLYYVKHRSLWLDLRILADTVKTVVGARESLPAAPAPQAAAAVSRRRLQVVPRPR
jgi:exopolysaccharide biosynthesis polyprenyl glycosylphosphotransferase